MPLGLEYDNIERYLESYGKYIVRQAKKILSKRDDTGNLTKSLGFKLEEGQDGYNIKFLASKYAAYVAQGVSGTRTRRSYIDITGKRLTTKFKFKSTSNLIGLEAATGIFSKYAKRKGIKGRSKKGRFITDKSLGFAIAQSVKRKGIKASSFYTQPISWSFKTFKKEMIENFKDDVLKEVKLFNKQK
tara:strand:- start:414 stop:974 length:561 start_codon:yes stop_codon:yes gene_type:complete